MTLKPPPLSPLPVLYFIPLVSILNLILFHQPLWIYITIQEELPGPEVWFALFSLLFMMSQLVLLGLALLSLRLCLCFCYLMFLGNALALYFLQQFHVVLDSDMMGNVLNTRTNEAGDFLSLTLAGYLSIYGLVPIVIVSLFAPRSTGRLKIALHWLGYLLFGFIGIYASSSGWLWIDQHAKHLGARLLPWSYLINTARHQIASQREHQLLLPEVTDQSEIDTLVVLVIGETARAANFSFYGYDRETTPALRQHDVIALQEAKACSTFTTASLKCILGHSPQNSFGQPYETLPSYLYRNGVEVIWRSNNWGEPSINVTQYQRVDELRQSCTLKDCSGDALLLSGLADRIRVAQQDKILIVLHQQGSHGPLYSKRYPASFEHFKPVCRTVELSDCSYQSLLNTYDNSLLYTDYLMGQLIVQLKQFSERPVLMMYLSDHGESLGEYGLYLHGTPYAIAPEFQKRIPFFLWMNQRFMDAHQLDRAILESRRTHNQYQVFHSILRAFGIESDIYDKSLDIFSMPIEH